VSSTTGLVVLASNSSTHKYWFADESLGGTPAPTAPTAGFTVSPTSGTAPLTVAFTDTSTGSPTSWSWDFGDGSAAATTQNPSHTYTAAGTYTVTLTATNAAGSTTATKTGAVTVGTTPTPTPTPTGTIAVRSSAKATSTAATTAVSLDAPSGLATGDVLVAQINADGAPALSSVPSGWSPVVTATLSPNSASKTFVYYHVVTDASSEPGSFAFGLSAAEKWGAGVTAYSGVSTTSPFDTAAVTKVNTSASSTVSLAGVTTATNGALLIGGVGVNSTGTTVSAPSGWTESWEADGGQDTSLASRTQGTAGATGAVSFPLSASSTAAGWMRALRPAS
jgi:PKD repeat protein